MGMGGRASFRRFGAGGPAGRRLGRTLVRMPPGLRSLHPAGAPASSLLVILRLDLLKFIFDPLMFRPNSIFLLLELGHFTLYFFPSSIDIY